jgi:hypothetical protein
MKLNLTKSQIGREEVNFLGFTIGTGITASQNVFEKVAELSKPQTVNEMQKFLGKLVYIRNHIAGYSRVAKHCYRGIIIIIIMPFSRRFYPKRLTVMCAYILRMGGPGD